MIQHIGLSERCIVYQDMLRHRSATTLRIVCELYSNAHVAAREPVMLDGLLANAVAREATGGEMLPPSSAPYEIPLPLLCLWRNEAGLPLWAASCLIPEGECARDAVYLHKRAQTGQFTKGDKRGRFSISTTTGRYMERRVITPTMTAQRWIAYAIGVPQEIERLLSFISHIGKRRAAGLGEVRRWRVEETLCDPVEVLVRDGRLIRPIPADAAGVLDVFAPNDPPGFCGWTPPYWLPATIGSAWRTGTPVRVKEAVCI